MTYKDYEDEEKERILRKYQPALHAIGINFRDDEIRDCIDFCSQDLELRLQAVISYYIWKHEHNEEVFLKQSLISAFHENWMPFEWKEEYLERPEFTSPAKKWFNEAREKSILRDIICDYRDNFDLDRYEIVFTHPYGKPWEIDVFRLQHMQPNEIITLWQEVTKVNIMHSATTLCFEQFTDDK